MPETTAEYRMENEEETDRLAETVAMEEFP